MEKVNEELDNLEPETSHAKEYVSNISAELEQANQQNSGKM